MAAPTGKLLPVGARYMTVFALDASGRPTGASAGTTAYAGTQLSGLKGLELNIPDPRVFDHAGEDGLIGRDMLPPLTGVAAKFMSSKLDYPMRKILTGVNTITQGEAVGQRYGTDQDGFLQQVGVHVWQQALEASGSNNGARIYRSVFFPRCLIYTKSPGMGENALDTEYNVVPQIVSQELWGITATLGTDAITSFQYSDWITVYRPKVVQWLQLDATEVPLLFPAAPFQAVATTKINAFTKNGVSDIAGATLATTGVTPPAGALANDVFVAFYEY